MYFHRLADLRIDHDKGQKEIASYLNMTRQVYGSYERGERELPVWALIKLVGRKAPLAKGAPGAARVGAHQAGAILQD